MSWRKGAIGGANQGQAPTKPTAVDPIQALTQDLAALTTDSEPKSTPQAKHQTEKFLVLNILQNIYESKIIDEKNYNICKTAIINSDVFEARHLMSYAPPEWEAATSQSSFEVKEDFPKATLNSCFTFLYDLAAYCCLPWRTVMTGTVLLQRYCYISSASENKSTKETDFIAQLNFSARVILVASCLLLATKAEESLCKISSILHAIRGIIGHTGYLHAIPASNQRSSHQTDIEEALAWPLRIQESIILEVLGFDVEVEHPHYFLRLIQVLPFSSSPLSPLHKQKILDYSFSLLSKCVIGTESNQFPLFTTGVTVAVAATYLSWFFHKDEFPEGETFNWDIFHFNPQTKREVKATVEHILSIINHPSPLPQFTNYLSFLFPCEKGEIKYSPAEGKCRGVQFYDKKEAICEGTYGTVWVAIQKETGEQVALKQLKNTIGRNGFPYYMLREILFLRRLKHENVVSGREVVCKHQRDGTLEFYIVMEYISFDMRDLWFAQKDHSAHPPWNEANIKHLVQQLLSGINYMHRRGLMHRDIKPENLLFDTGVLKVADLGSIRDAGRTALKLTTAVVTLWYRPPELLLGNTEYTSAIDIWSIGCVIVEFLTMSALFPGRDVDDMMFRIAACLGKPSPEIWSEYFQQLPMANKIWPIISHAPRANPLELVLKNYSPACADLVSKMVCYDPTARITAEEALNHPYFKQDPLPVIYLPKQ